MAFNEKTLEERITTIACAILVALVSWIGLTVQTGATDMAAVKTEIGFIKEALKDQRTANDAIILNSQTLVSLEKRISRLEARRD